MLIQGGKSNDGNVTGLDLSTVRASNGTAMYSVTNGVKTDYIAEPTQKDGGILLASGNYANPVAGNSSTYVSDDAPPESYQRSGQRWWVPSEGLAYIWYEDGDSGQWVQENNATAPMPSHNDTLDRNAVGAHDDIYIRAVTLAEAQAEDAPVGTRYIITDLGDARYDVVDSGDTGGFYKAVLASGRKVKLSPVNKKLLLSWIGVLSGDATADLQKFASISDGLDVVFNYDLSCTISSEVNFANPKSIDFGNTTISFDASSVSKPITIGNHNITEVYTLTSELPKNSGSVSFANSLDQGDILCIYNPINGSFNAHRESYRSGEYIGVSTSDGNMVTLDGTTRDIYPPGSKIYKLSFTKTNITGMIKAINIGIPAVCYGLQVRSNANANYTGLEVYLKNGTHAVSLNRNINCTGKSMIVYQSGLTGLGLDYGLVQAGNQNCDFEGWFHAERHGHTSGTDGSAGIAVCRDLRVGGRVTTTGAGGVPAMDYHGDAEFCKCWGYLQGTSLGGHKTTIESGSQVVSHANNAFAVSYAELLSTDHIASGISIVGRGTPSGGRGVVDVGGNSNVITGATTIGGNFDFTNSTIESDTTGPVLSIRNRGAAVVFGVILEGIASDCPSASTLLAGTAVSGSSMGFVSFNNLSWGDGLSLDTNTEVKGAILKGVVNINYTTSQNIFTSGVTFSPPFPSGRTPHVTISDNTGTVGTTSVISDVVNPTNSDFFARILTNDGANFQSSGTSVTRWRAEIS